MKYLKMNGTDLNVSALCLGTMNYGGLYPESMCFGQMDMFMDFGGNFIDTAHIYNDWIPGELCRSEKIIGRWLKEKKCRHKVVLSTKGGHPELDQIRAPRVNRHELQKDLDESLVYLNTDYIDIYFLHRDDPDVPVEEIVGFLGEKVKEGKIRYFGCSNWRLNRIKQAVSYAEKHKTPGFICNQLMWSLAQINADKLPDPDYVVMDNDIRKFHMASKMNVMAYSSQAKGYFQRRAIGEELPESIRTQYDNRMNGIIYEKLMDLNDKTGVSLTAMALMYMMNQPFVCIPIVSCDNDDQLIGCVEACDMKINGGLEELMKL